MNINCSPETELVIREHGRLLAELKYPQAKTLVQKALRSRYEDSPISLDVAQLLDELALGCRDLEEFEEASMYLAQSLAIKKLLFGPDHKEVATAKERLLAASTYLDREPGKIEFSQWWSSAPVETQRSIKQGRLRCLVIAKSPEEMYFGDTCHRSTYVVVCEDGQIGCLTGPLADSSQIELGQEIEACPFRIYLGCLMLYLEPDFLVKKEAPVTEGQAVP